MKYNSAAFFDAPGAAPPAIGHWCAGAGSDATVGAHLSAQPGERCRSAFRVDDVGRGRPTSCAAGGWRNAVLKPCAEFPEILTNAL
mmetsp:Transcript_25428/g.71419  ORF Transcript_25428/g.71419 Transcript_25428/m.71419 type:complete len:86 (-) Transcript_25428:42-299(-)